MAETEEQAARAKEAVDAMKHAKSNMGVVLDRVSQLERALHDAAASISVLKDYIGPGCYTYPADSSRRVKCRDVADDAAAKIAKVLA